MMTMEKTERAGSSQAEFGVRAYREADYPALVEIWKAAGRKPYSQKSLTRILAADGGVLVAETNNPASEVIGVLLWSHNGRVAHLWRLAVAEAHRGKGVATALLKQAETDIAAAGLESIGLLVLSHNVAAKSLYTKHGWQLNEGVEYWGKRIAPTENDTNPT